MVDFLIVEEIPRTGDNFKSKSDQLLIKKVVLSFFDYIIDLRNVLKYLFIILYKL